jgi:hypothetical protein
MGRQLGIVAEQSAAMVIHEDGSSDVNIQDQTTPPFQYYLLKELKTDIKLQNPANKNDETLVVTSGNGFVVGEYIVLWEDSKFEQNRVTNVDIDGVTITIDSPLCCAFSTNATVVRGSNNLAIDASTGEHDYVFKMYQSEIPIDVNVLRLNMIHSTEGDDSRFGNLTELDNGMYARKENNHIVNYGNYRKNLDYEDRGALVTYSDKAGGGKFSTKIEFDVKSKYGVSLRIDPRIKNPLTNKFRDPDLFRVRLRDNLSSLTSFTVSLIGHYTQGE